MVGDNSKVALTLDNMLSQLRLLVKDQCCKLDQVIAALGGGTATYDTVEHIQLAATDVFSAVPGSVHSISFTVTAGTLDLTINGITATYPTGYSGSIEFTTINSNPLDFAASATGGAIIVYTHA